MQIYPYCHETVTSIAIIHSYYHRMANYHYKESSLIESVTFQMPHPGIAQATIVAKKEATPEQLEALRVQLGAHDFSTMMDMVDGVPAIAVRGLKDEKKLLTTLVQIGVTGDGFTKEATPEDSQKVDFHDKVRGKALFLSAIFYDLGNAAFIASGIMRGRHNLDGKLTAHDKSEMLIGGAFSVGDVLMTVAGENKGDEELRAVEEGLQHHLNRKGVVIPEGNALNPDTLHQSGAFKAVHNWLHSHVIQVKCLSEIAGGLFTM